jgi:hypothetical protein
VNHADGALEPRLPELPQCLGHGTDAATPEDCTARQLQDCRGGDQPGACGGSPTQRSTPLPIELPLISCSNSKLESGAIKPDPAEFAVSALFDELRREFADLASNKGLTLNVSPCDDSVHSDPSLVGQILRNLVSNAIKYTRAGWVALRCLHDRRS